MANKEGFQNPGREINIVTLNNRRIQQNLHSEVSNAINEWGRAGLGHNEIINNTKDTLMDKALDISQQHKISRTKANNIVVKVYNDLFNTDIKTLK